MFSDYLDGVGTQMGGILSSALDATGTGFVNRLSDPVPVVVDQTPVASDAQGADSVVSVPYLAKINDLPIYVKIGGGALGLLILYKLVK